MRETARFFTSLRGKTGRAKRFVQNDKVSLSTAPKIVIPRSGSEAGTTQTLVVVARRVERALERLARNPG